VGVPRVEETDPEGVDYGWVMQTTFVLTIVVGAPLVGLLALSRPLPTWTGRALFAVRVGAVVWFVSAVGVYLYARRQGAGDGGETTATDSADETTPAEDDETA